MDRTENGAHRKEFHPPTTLYTWGDGGTSLHAYNLHDRHGTGGERFLTGTFWHHNGAGGSIMGFAFILPRRAYGNMAY